MRIPFISLMAAGALALGGCAYGGVGLGYGSPYYGYGYSSPYYGYGYGSSYYGGGFGSPYYGWYDNYYYPGSGTYVYDSYRRPFVMTTSQRSYWSTRSPALRASGTRTQVRENWSGFSRHTTTQSTDRHRHHHND